MNEHELLNSNVREVAKTEQGKAFIWEILSYCGMYSNQFTGNSGTFFNEGKRAVGLDIIGILNDADPTIYPRLLLDRADSPDA